MAMTERCACLGHRHSIFCILPPYILREIANRGDADQRKFALDTLALDSTARSTREVAGERMALGRVTLRRPPLLPHVNRLVYDDRHTTTPPGTLVRGEGQPATGDVSVNEAYDGLGHVFDFYFGKYRRNSIDNAGMRLVATVHYSTGYNNAFWNGTEMIFGDGDGKIFTRFTSSIDVIGHELTHGVTQYEAALAYHDQPGALNESMSDVFGVMVKQMVLNQTAAQADWLIGAGLLASFPTQALRSMKAPGTAYNNALMGHDPQPADMAHYVNTQQDNGGVHINSGIPNRAFYLLAIALGGNAWEKAGKIWYDTQRDPQLKAIRATATFHNFADLTVAHARALYGAASAERQATINAWHTVGVI
jgi:Zn-dependent metalloprotease